MNWAVTHGGDPELLSEQPAIVHGELSVIAGWLPSSTRVLGTVGIAWPAWAQMTVAPIWTSEAGIR
jgi:hypothetical protein